MKPELGCTDAETDPIHVAAADWLLRMQDPQLSLEETLAWQDWMKASPRHAEAFSRLEEISEAAARLPLPRKPGWHELTRDRYDGSASL